STPAGLPPRPRPHDVRDQLADRCDRTPASSPFDLGSAEDLRGLAEGARSSTYCGQISSTRVDPPSLKNSFENVFAACGLAAKIAKPQAARGFSKQFLKLRALGWMNGCDSLRPG